jgi:hypothetical protein
MGGVKATGKERAGCEEGGGGEAGQKQINRRGKGTLFTRRMHGQEQAEDI